VGRNNSVGIATRYTIDGPGIESRGCEIFHTRPDWPRGPPNLLYNGYRVFPGSKAAGSWPWPVTPSNAEVNERVELYFYSSSGSTFLVIGWTLTLSLPLPFTFTFTFTFTFIFYTPNILIQRFSGMETFAVISTEARIVVWDAGIENISHKVTINSSWCL
jgi:hypothetical protein